MVGRAKSLDSDAFLHLLSEVRDKFKSQDPVYLDSFEKVLFVGDIHGDIGTVSKVKRRLKNYDRVVFLGDYVDRGLHDIEVVIELAKLFLNEPKIVLLAGNHDAYNNFWPRDWPEKLYKIYRDSSSAIDRAYTDSFKQAPVAYYHEKYRVLALHAFIPRSKPDWDFTKWKKAEGMDWPEILWNDPTDVNGIHRNQRGTGIWSIGPDVTSKFMEMNRLDYIVRSHQPMINKITKLPGKKMLVNIGSSMHYGIRCFFSMPQGKIIDVTGK